MGRLTDLARKRHAEGVSRLNDIFGWTPAHATNPRGGGPNGIERRRRKQIRLSRKKNHS